MYRVESELYYRLQVIQVVCKWAKFEANLLDLYVIYILDAKVTLHNNFIKFSVWKHLKTT
jgi:hypothetical protein